MPLFGRHDIGCQRAILSDNEAGCGSQSSF